MKRIFGEYVYSDAPRANPYWDSITDVPAVPDLDRSLNLDVAIVGAGFTGLNAALTLAKRGASIGVFDSNGPGWGASGRNGGFCCLGGGIADDRSLDKRFGKLGRLEWRAAEKSAVSQVSEFLRDHSIDAGVHSQGETLLAHRSRHAKGLDVHARSIEENYGVKAQVHTANDLENAGMFAGFHGGVTTPIGFAFNPRAYLAGLVSAVLGHGGEIYGKAPVLNVEKGSGGWVLTTANHKIRAKQVIFATNGYSSEDVPEWLAARYLPVQSSVAVTQPIAEQDRIAQGWTSHQMCFDTRNLLHYFHLLPDNRMLFGMRGGLRGTAQSDVRALARLKRDFQRIFPKWQHVTFEYQWSGMVCFAQSQLPFVGPIPKAPGLWTALAFHGNGVAMGSFAGRLVGDLVSGAIDTHHPQAMKTDFRKFPFGGLRRALLPPAYAVMMAFDL